MLWSTIEKLYLEVLEADPEPCRAGAGDRMARPVEGVLEILDPEFEHTLAAEASYSLEVKD